MSVDLFDFAAERLEQQTSLDRLAARGTLRIALKAAGLSPNGLRVRPLGVVLERVLPAELEKRGVEDARMVCAKLATALAGASIRGEASDSADTDEIFRRLGDS